MTGRPGHRSEAQQQRVDGRLNELANSSARLAMVELGAGSAIPGVRHTSEQVVGRLGGTLIRINPREPETPGRHIGLPFGAVDGIGRICHCAETLGGAARPRSKTNA